MKFLTMSLTQALENYPAVRQLNLVEFGDSESSAMLEFLWYRSSLEHSRVTVVLALKDDQPIAWIWLIHRSRIYSKPNRFYLSWLFVHPDFRKQGIGSKLFAQAKALTHKRHRLILVQPWDYRSTKFFRKFGTDTLY